MISLWATEVPSAFGTFALLWSDNGSALVLQRVVLPSESIPQSHRLDPGLMRRSNSSAIAADMTSKLQRYLVGEPVSMGLEHLDFSQCSDFQKSVLCADHAIPRGSVTTYGRLARQVGLPRASRAVGRALACNPFPIIIPCHRVVTSNGEVGGYRGGPDLKKTLLRLEKVRFLDQNRVALSRVLYFGACAT